MKLPILIIAIVASIALHAAALIPLTQNQASAKPKVVPVELVELPEPEPQPIAEPEPEPKVEPQPEPRPEPQPEPVTPPAPEPTPAPQPEIKPQPQPKLPPEPAPQPEPKAQPPVTPPIQSDTDSGSFAGSTTGQPAPRLRIDWTTSDQARRAIAAGRMKLAAVDMSTGAPALQQVVIDANGRAQRQTGKMDTTGYHPEVRNVTHVDAFTRWGRDVALKQNEHLILILPHNLASRIRLQHRQAVQAAGLSWSAGSMTTGRFRVDSNRLTFDIHQVQAQ